MDLFISNVSRDFVFFLQTFFLDAAILWCKCLSKTDLWTEPWVGWGAGNTTVCPCNFVLKQHSLGDQTLWEKKKKAKGKKRHQPRVLNKSCSCRKWVAYIKGGGTGKRMLKAVSDFSLKRTHNVVCGCDFGAIPLNYPSQTRQKSDPCRIHWGLQCFKFDF